MGAVITGPKSLLEKTFADGSDNPFWYLLNYADFIGIPIEVQSDDTARFGPATDYEKLGVAQVSGVVGLGGEVENYPCWIKVTDMTANVPNYVPGHEENTGTLEAPVMSPVTWENWNDGRHTPTVIDSVNYVPGDSLGPYIKGSVISQLVANGFEVLSKPKIKALMSAE